MGKWLKVILGTLRSSVGSRRELALENLAVPPEQSYFTCQVGESIDLSRLLSIR